MVLAPVAEGKVEQLRAMLVSMNLSPGVVNPKNELVPFGEFDRLHVARFVVLDLPTADSITVYTRAPVPWPTSLAFLGDTDGPATGVLEELAERCGPGLRQIFAHCEGFGPTTDLLSWMTRHERPSAADYVNRIGRTVRQVHEERALRDALVAYVHHTDTPRDELATATRARLVKFVDEEKRAGRLTLTAPEQTPFAWRLRNAMHAVGVPIALLLLTPFLVIASPVLVYMLRRREKTDPDSAPRPGAEHIQRVGALEDHEISNQFTVFGDLKPGLFRQWLTALLLCVLNYTARHIFNRGYLTRVQTIHFARWVFVDERRRLFFASNYDGSVESYWDDFINKIGWGVNLVFTNGLGYPRTDWLVQRGARDEQKYKRVLRRHQFPTDVWYKAYPGLTAVDLHRNTLIRQGIERTSMTDQETREWLRLL